MKTSVAPSALEGQEVRIAILTYLHVNVLENKQRNVLENKQRHLRQGLWHLSKYKILIPGGVQNAAILKFSLL